ncbi:hypothetical protein HQ544_04395 [Candidatus Falkowbacteria bacterium]|nr:hypothetical protein [Candidatus Falkowbacteria bacterium]
MANQYQHIRRNARVPSFFPAYSGQPCFAIVTSSARILIPKAITRKIAVANSIFQSVARRISDTLDSPGTKKIRLKMWVDRTHCQVELLLHFNPDKTHVHALFRIVQDT